MTDSQFRELLRKSPQTAHRAVFDEYYSYVYTIVFNRLRSTASREDVDECVSDVFSDVFLKYDADSPYDGDIKGFISSVAIHRSIDMFRRLTAKNKGTVSLDDEMGRTFPSDEDVAEDAEKRETCHAVLDAVKALGEPDATIVIQKYYYNRSSVEIAEMVEMKPDAVRKRVSRAVNKLRGMLAAVGEGR
ncbi:MAG: sigma-70 family RNA polymerase sigma factor [Ruminococcus sp.]|nr:sigma-70 family RNA polymerase sigma factor [Ruminococcus sp.]